MLSRERFVAIASARERPWRAVCEGGSSRPGDASTTPPAPSGMPTSIAAPRSSHAAQAWSRGTTPTAGTPAPARRPGSAAGRPPGRWPSRSAGRGPSPAPSSRSSPARPAPARSASAARCSRHAAIDGSSSVVAQPRARPRRLLLADHPQHLQDRRLLQPLAVQRRRAGQQLVEQHAQAVDVASGCRCRAGSAPPARGSCTPACRRPPRTR